MFSLAGSKDPACSYTISVSEALLFKLFIISGCLLSLLFVPAHATEISPTYLFDSDPSTNRSGPIDAAIQFGFYAANLILVQRCDIQRHRPRRQWENRIGVGVLNYGSRYRLSGEVRTAAEAEARKQLDVILQRGRIPLDMCKNADAMFTKALTANMEPPTGTLASSDAEMENERLVDQLKDGFSGSVRLRKKILSFNVDHFTRTDHHNFEAVIHWKGSGAANVVKGHVSGYEQLLWKETASLAGKRSREYVYVLNRRSPTAMAGSWGDRSRGGFVEIKLPASEPE